MSLKTFSAFYFGHEVTKDNFVMTFDEGAGELVAELNVGAYTLTDFVEEAERALNAAGTLTYSVSVNRDTRIINIAADDTFDLLCLSGLNNGNALWQLVGFNENVDKTGASAYDADFESGSIYLPQFILQDHIDPEHWVQSVDASVNKSARGDVEVVTFGEEKFLQANIRYITNLTQDGAIIKTDGTGVEKTVEFMNYITAKNPIEFMANINDRSIFLPLLLESTPESSKGTGFRLKEMYDKGLPFYFETGPLKFRVYDL